MEGESCIGICENGYLVLKMFRLLGLKGFVKLKNIIENRKFLIFFGSFEFLGIILGNFILKYVEVVFKVALII